ncbi:hypothetical protein DFJ73DRAFT_428811 [Zopfochytrium polystomum]|nr:hypothetical protein DFJ73DRAFT_428811 [Zopfochytrium polystomum]
MAAATTTANATVGHGTRSDDVVVGSVANNSSSTYNKKDLAVHYLNQLRAELPEPAFAEFMNILTRFKRKELSRRAVVTEIDSLLCEAGHPELVNGFSVFLPRGWTMDSVREASSYASSADRDDSNTGSTADIFAPTTVMRPVPAPLEKRWSPPRRAYVPEGVVYPSGSYTAAPSAEPGDGSSWSRRSSTAGDPDLSTTPTFELPNMPFLNSVRQLLESRGEGEKYNELIEIIQECRTIPSSASIVSFGQTESPFQRLPTPAGPVPNNPALLDTCKPFIVLGF